MKVTIKEKDNTKELLKVLKQLNKKEINVGILGDPNSEIAKIARVHEYGMTITPKKGKYLAIPSHRSSKGKNPRDFGDLFFISTGNGNGLLAKNRGRDAFDVYFVLVKSVTIPERSFLRSGYDENINHIMKSVADMLPSVLDFGIDPNLFLNMIGQEFAGLIQKKMKTGDFKENATLTADMKGSSNPLMDTGRLVGAIEYEVK